MSILAQPTAQPTLAQAAALGVRDLNSATLQAFVDGFRENFRRVWHRGDGVSAQQVFDEFGADAGRLFAAANATVQFIATFAQINGHQLSDFLAPEDYTPPLPYVIHDDGTVTVGQAP